MSGSDTDDDSPDYMSDAFVSTSFDVRPGVVFGAEARKHKLECRRMEIEEEIKNSKKPCQLAHEVRETGLKTALSSDNKGFALMAKMGYQSGMSLGLKNNGIAEPIGIEVKSDRMGLGHASKRADQLILMRKRDCERLQNRESLLTDYKDRKRSRVAMNQLYSDLKKAQAACYNLDNANVAF